MPSPLQKPPDSVANVKRIYFDENISMHYAPAFGFFEKQNDNAITDCPNCQRTYDDADADFLICHHCGYDAEEKRFKPGNRTSGHSRFGIDPDHTLDDWS